MGLSASQARFLQLTARKSNIEYEAQRISYERLQIASDMADASTKYENAMSNRHMVFRYNTGSGVQEAVITYANYKSYMNQQLEGLQTTQEKYYLVSQSGKLVVSSADEMNAMIQANTTRIPVSDIQNAKKQLEAAQVTGDESGITASTRELASYDISGEYPSEIIEDDEGNPVEYYVIQQFTPEDFLIVDDLDDVDAFQSAIQDGTYYFATLEYDKETNEPYFNTQGWDTLGGGAIVEVYDTSDDAAAQAEYDVTQAKLQKLDKQLEMRLDQLETQRQAIATEIEGINKVIEDNIEQTFKTFG